MGQRVMASLLMIAAVPCTAIDDCGVSVTDLRYCEVPVNAAPADADERVTSKDPAGLGLCQRQSNGGGADLDRSGSIDFGDLTLLSQDWLLTTSRRINQGERVTYGDVHL